MRLIRWSPSRMPKPQSSTPQLLDTTRRSPTPAVCRALIRVVGTPQRPNPPTASDEPAATSATASTADATTLSTPAGIAISLPSRTVARQTRGKEAQVTGRPVAEVSPKRGTGPGPPVRPSPRGPAAGDDPSAPSC